MIFLSRRCWRSRPRSLNYLLTASNTNAFEFKSYRKILNVSYKEHRTNNSIAKEIVERTRNHETLLSVVKQRKLEWFGHVTRRQGTLPLANVIMHGRTPNKRGTGRPRKAWLTNIAEWTGLTIIEATRRAQNRKEWKKLLWSLRVYLRPP